jgi:hypothetical protein
VARFLLRIEREGTMNRVLALAMLCGIATASCGRGPASQAPPPEEQQVIPRTDTRPLETRGGARPAPVNVTGCLTAAGDRFVLTQLRESDSTTDAYQLVNADDQLRSLVGQQVRIGGEAEAPKVAVVREHEVGVAANGQATGTSGTGDAEPNIRTQETAKIATRRMSVLSVTPTGDRCAAQGATR